MSRLIEKEGKHYIKGKVVMLASNNPSHIYLITKTKKLSWVTGKDSPSDLEQFPQTIIETQNQHLYITSDNEIKEGDWYLNLFEGRYKVYKCNNELLYDGVNKKIIATTDSALGLPSPSESFIMDFIEAYNNGNVIEDVLIEVEEIKGDLGIILSLTNEDFKLKLKDNNIIIKKVKENLTREEAIELIKDAVAESLDWSKANDNIHSFAIIEGRFLNKWIEDKL